MRILPICFAILALARVAHADGTVIARATDQRGGFWVACGVVYSVGWVVYAANGIKQLFLGLCPWDTEIVGQIVELHARMRANVARDESCALARASALLR
jgi:hypothetical protein